ncbi:hypothetical protein Tco_0922591 [Tanacetum coccineum]|uniref:Uncharacterized protein n=1 Tax=Tanacetum coccineum TaxID=301880 RepID=A0ABQ5CZZ0_9ASTR
MDLFKIIRREWKVFKKPRIQGKGVAMDSNNKRAEQWTARCARALCGTLRVCALFSLAVDEPEELGEAKKILGMEIVRDRSRKILRVSQSGIACPVRDCDVERMSKVSYANAVGSLMYLMVDHWLRIFSTGMCCKLEGNTTTRGGSFNYRGRVYGPYGGCEGSYLAKGNFFEELGVGLKLWAVNCVNQGAIHLSGIVFHERDLSHINVRYSLHQRGLGRQQVVKVREKVGDRDTPPSLPRPRDACRSRRSWTEVKPYNTAWSC